MKKLFIAVISLMLAATLSAAENLIKNGDFSKGFDDWKISNYNSVEVEKEGSNSFLHLKNTKNEYIDASQYIEIKPGTIKTILVKAKIKLKNVVKGPEDWAYARVMVLFYNSSGAQTGGWPEMGRWHGTFNWSERMNVINIPSDAAKIMIQVQLSNCTGEMWADEIRVLPDAEFEIPRDEDDMVMNGSLEFGADKPLYWGGYVNGQGSFESPGHDSPQCYKIHNPAQAYSMIKQQIPIDTSKVNVVIISGYVKTKDIVTGGNSWEKARISVEFHNEKGRFGGWPPVVGETSSDLDVWTKWENNYLVPKETKFIEIAAGLLEAKGTMYIDDIKVVGKDSNGKTYKPKEFKGEDKSKWFAFTAKEDPYTKDAVVDFTEKADKPAGKHGEMSADKNGKLLFKDGTPAKFWGTNLVAGDVFRNKEETDRTVKRLAKLGCNLVRLHHMDAQWSEPNIFNKSGNNTRRLSDASLEKLDYLTYKLKEAGMYIFLDTLVHRKPKSGDGVDSWSVIPQGFKGVIFIDDKLKELTKEYMKQLFEHENKYTKLKYKDDPAVVFTEIINESTLFYWDRDKEIPVKYTKKLDEMFNKYLKNKYGTMEKMEDEWVKYGDSNLGDEDFNKGTVQRERFKIDWEDWRKFASAVSTGRAADTKRFYFETEKKFYDEMYDFLKNEIKVKALVTGSNHWEHWDAELYVNSNYDFIDRHSYWDHPSGGWTYQENISFKNHQVLKSKSNCVAELAHARVYKKPFTVSEWNFLPPNEFITGAPVIMAAYGKYQDWDALMQFNFGTYTWKNIFEHFGDFSRNPGILAQWFPANMIFMHDYVKTGSKRIIEYVSENDMFNTKSGSYKVVNDDFTSPQMIKVYKSFSSKDAERKFSPVVKKGAALSMTGELYWNYKKGLFEVNASKIQGVTGSLKALKDPVKLRNLRVSSKNKYAAIFLTSLDKSSISASSGLILNTAARMDNTGTKYSPSHTSIIYGGSAPILIEPVYSTITVTVSKFKKAKVYKLDENYYKDGVYDNYTISGNIIKIKTDEKSKCLNYYIELER